MKQLWKLITLALGIAVLMVGAYIEQLPDWDYGLSILMAVLTYLTAPYLIRAIYFRNWTQCAIGLVGAWITIDASYVIYSELMGNIYVREANIIASTPLYLIMGIIWSFNGSLQDLWRHFPLNRR
jgi:hypothetical protein